MVHRIEYQNTLYDMKISNRNLEKEHKVVEEMRKYINRYELNVIMDISFIQGFA